MSQQAKMVWISAGNSKLTLLQCRSTDTVNQSVNHAETRGSQQTLGFLTGRGVM